MDNTSREFIMNLRETPLEGVVIFEPKVFEDARGFFTETFRQDIFEKRFPDVHFVQDNLSRSSRGVLRGLHFQSPHAQGKLVRVVRGTVWDVVVDLRPESQTFGQHFGIELSEENKLSLYVPPDFAHGFCVLSDLADFSYKCTEYYSAPHDSGLLWNDPELNISWPILAPLVSEKDSRLPTFAQIKKIRLK